MPDEFDGLYIALRLVPSPVGDEGKVVVGVAAAIFVDCDDGFDDDGGSGWRGWLNAGEYDGFSGDGRWALICTSAFVRSVVLGRGSCRMVLGVLLGY